MGLFGRDKKEKPKPPEKKLIIGVNPELVDNVKQKVKRIHDEKQDLRKKYDSLIERMAEVEAKAEAIDETFRQFKDELMTDFMSEARKELTKEMNKRNESIDNNHSRLLKLEDELLKISKMQDEAEFISSFQDYYQLIKLCIYLITNAEPVHQDLVTLLLQTIHSLVDDMRRNNFWESGKDAIITSMLNLKTYWRNRDERIESLIGAEIDALESLR